jgi:hypothetical protein
VLPIGSGFLKSIVIVLALAGFTAGCIEVFQRAVLALRQTWQHRPESNGGYAKSEVLLMRRPAKFVTAAIRVM